ncbi:Cep104 [Symbiodinium necroappetens]|uniref:Cep104 protein n=1 Tax=Symbiodinium necroappetens TaxID=1628268 RepID=A0A812YGD2_9DINO|nr:Cep104 [Symbiodinium necroappetens]
MATTSVAIIIGIEIIPSAGAVCCKLNSENIRGRDEKRPVLAYPFARYIIQCVFSKSWSLRDAALQKLALQITHTDILNMQDTDRLLSAYVTILVRTIPDKNVQVFHSSSLLLKAVCSDLIGGASFGRPRQVSLEPLLVPLAERLGDGNARVEKTARDAHWDIARSVGAAFAAQHLLRAPKKKTVPPRVFSSRLQLLAALVSEFGVQPKSRDGIALEPAAQLAMEWFSNPAAEVRESAVKLMAACYSHVGLSRIEMYLAHLRQAQREVFDAEFQRVSHAKAPAPPSRPAPMCTPVALTNGNHSAEDASDAEESDAESMEEFFCQFCGREDPNFTLAALDIHYWRECPMLTACKLCEQVIEISRMHWHLMEECEAGEAAVAQARRFSPERYFCIFPHGHTDRLRCWFLFAKPPGRGYKEWPVVDWPPELAGHPWGPCVPLEEVEEYKQADGSICLLVHATGLEENR